MGEIGLVEEGGRTDGVEKGPGPGSATMHTMGIFNRRTHIGLHTLDTGLLVTLAAFRLFSHNRCIRLRANGTGGNFDDLVLGLPFGRLWLWNRRLWNRNHHFFPLQNEFSRHSCYRIWI